jgi:hypothetical protein
MLFEYAAPTYNLSVKVSNPIVTGKFSPTKIVLMTVFVAI